MIQRNYIFPVIYFQTENLEVHINIANVITGKILLENPKNHIQHMEVMHANSTI